MAKAPPQIGAPRIKREAWAGNNASKRKITGRALQRARAQLFARDPLCAECRRKGETTIATIRDHVVPLSQRGQDVVGNTQGLCEPCHDAKTKREAADGARRARRSVQ